jgi:hypothetical protein
MSDHLKQELAVATQAVRDADNLMRMQEAEAARMREGGLNTERAEALLAAYREGVRYAIERRKALEELARLRWRSKGDKPQ